MIDLIWYFKKMKEYSIHSSSNEEFLDDLLSPLVSSLNLLNKNGETFHLDKTRTSKLISRNDEIPNVLRNAIQTKEIDKKMREYMRYFLEHIYNVENLDDLMFEIKQEINESLDDSCNLKYKIDNADTIDFFSIVLLYVLSINIKMTDQNVFWQRGTSQADYVIGDIFRYRYDKKLKKKNILVIPVDTSFETRVVQRVESNSKPLVSDTSIHGKWLKEIISSTEDTVKIRERIYNDLQLRGLCYKKEIQSNDKRVKIYNIGDVAILEDNVCIYFLLAISEFNSNNNAQSSKANIIKSIDSLIEFYDCYGQGKHMYMPLLGTALSRANVSTKESFDMIKERLISNKDSIHGHITLVIYSECKSQLLNI